MPPRRSTRASSVEDSAPASASAQAPARSSRTSRRLRSTQDSDASPLRALSPPRRKRNAKTATDSTSTLYTTPSAASPARQDMETTAGVSEAASVSTWAKVAADQHAQPESEAVALFIKKQPFSVLRKVFTHPITFPEFYSMLTFENAGHHVSSFHLRCDSEVKVALTKVAKNMTDEEKVDLMIEQRAQIVDREEKYRNAKRIINLQRKQNEELQEQLEAATEEKQVGEETVETPSRKRPAPTEAGTETASEERPARRVKVAPSSSELIATPEPIVDEFPLTRALAASNAKSAAYGMLEDEEDSLFSMRDREDARSPGLQKFKSFVAERMRQREQEEKEQKWLGAAFSNVNTADDLDNGIPVLSEQDDREEAGPDGEQSQGHQAVEVAIQIDEPYSMSGALISSTSQALTPIREESEPQTPSSSRWGFRSLLAPVTRLFGVTPRTEPARRHPPPPAGGISAPTSTPTISHSTRRQSSNPSNISFSNRATTASIEDEDEPATPIRPSTGITSASFAPQSAPQARTAAAPAPRRRSHAEKIKAFDKTAAKRREAEEKARQAALEAEQARRQAAEEAEDKRLRAEALELRKQSIMTTQKTGQKRKIRVDDLDVIPNPTPGSFGMNDKYFEEDSDGEVYVDEDVSMMDAFTPPPHKKVRFDEPPASERLSQKKPWWQTETFNDVSPHIKNPPTSLSSDPHRAQPYTGSMFADTRGSSSYDGGNVFEQSQSRDAKKAFEESYLSPVTYAKKHHVWTAPKSPPKARPTDFNYEGHFAVPDDSDTESEYEESEQLDSPTKAQNIAAEKRTSSREDARSKAKLIVDEAVDGENEGDEPEARTNLFMKRSEQTKAATQSEPKNDKLNEPAFTQQPPPPPTPAHAALPGTPAAAAASAQSDSDALAKARLQAEKYKPKTPSGLRATSRLSASPIVQQKDEGITEDNRGPMNTNISTTLFGQIPATPPTSMAAGTTIASQISATSSAATSTTDIPYEQTIQYAIDLAKAVPLDQLPVTNFVWPTSTPAPWPLDPQVEAELKAAEQHPDWNNYCDQVWSSTWNRYQKEKSEGKHGGLISASAMA